MAGSWRADLCVCCMCQGSKYPWHLTMPSSASSHPQLSIIWREPAFLLWPQSLADLLSHALIVKPHKSVCEELPTPHLLMLLCFFSSSVLFRESPASTHLPCTQLLQIHFPDPVRMSPLPCSLPNSPPVSVTLRLWSWSPTLFTIDAFTCLFMNLQGGGITKGKEQELCTLVWV